MQRNDLLAIMATLLIREQYVSAQGAQFEGAVDDAEALLKVIESRRKVKDRPLVLLWMACGALIAVVIFVIFGK
jgi:hypothetical protein